MSYMWPPPHLQPHSSPLHLYINRPHYVGSGMVGRAMDRHTDNLLILYLTNCKLNIVTQVPINLQPQIKMGIQIHIRNLRPLYRQHYNINPP